MVALRIASAQRQTPTLAGEAIRLTPVPSRASEVAKARETPPSTFAEHYVEALFHAPLAAQIFAYVFFPLAALIAVFVALVRTVEQEQAVRALVHTKINVADYPALKDPAVWARGGVESPYPVARQLLELRNRDPDAFMALRRRIMAHDIVCLQRFSSLESVVSMLNALEAPPDDRPLAVIVATRDDYNAALQNLNNVVAMVKTAYRTLYVEAGSDREVVAALARVSKGQPTSLLLLAAHGSSVSMAFGSPWTDRGTLDAGDDAELRALGSLLSDDATIANISCETGKGGAASFAAALSAHTNRRVVSAAEKILLPVLTTRSSNASSPLGRGLHITFDQACVEYSTRALRAPTACAVSLVKPR